MAPGGRARTVRPGPAAPVLAVTPLTAPASCYSSAPLAVSASVDRYTESEQ